MAIPNKSKFIIEDGLVVGTGDKYNQKNPIARHLISQFDKAIAQIVKSLDPGFIVEVGCGEGHITQILEDTTSAEILATDISDTVLETAKHIVSSERVTFKQQNIYDLTVPKSPDLIICCEVLEHLDNPATGLHRLAKLANPYCLMSVPREPTWRILNFLRGAYVKDFGNSPGHLQHWSRRKFLEFVESEFQIQKVASPLPWTIVLGVSKYTA